MRSAYPFGLAAAFLLSGCNVDIDTGRTRETTTETKTVERAKVEMTRAEITMGAGELELQGGAKALFEGKFTTNLDRSRPDVRFESTGFRGHLSVRQRNSGGVIGGKVVNRWEMKLADDVPLDLDVTLGAGESILKLGSLTLRSGEVKLGAGRCEVDLRGTTRRSYELRLRGGVGEAVVYVPRDAGVTAEAAGGIGEIDVRGLNREGRSWRSANYGQTPHTIRLDLKGGIGSIRIVAE
jgi:hypothetical protein